MTLRLLFILILVPLAVGANDAALPNPPTGHLLDRSGGFPDAHVEQLETELSRLRTEHHVDVLVIIWDRALPADYDPDAFARHLGQNWAREDLWAVVLQMPGSVNRPVIAYDGSVMDSLPQEPVDASIRAAIDRGMKEWTEPDRLCGVALGLGEELVYLRLRRQYEQGSVGKAAADAGATAQQEKNTLMIRTVLGVVAGLLLIGGGIAARVLIRRRHPAQLAFPDTRWRRRLGAPWSGGSDIVTTFTPPDLQG